MTDSLKMRDQEAQLGTNRNWQENALLPGRIIGSWILSITSIFFSIASVTPLIFTDRNAFGGLGAQFNSLWFWAVPGAVASWLLAFSYRRVYWQSIGVGKIASAISLAAVSLITAIIVGTILVSQLPS